MEIWQDLAFKKKENQIAVVVDHDGTRSPYGAYLVIDGEEEQFISSPTDRSMPWFWSGDPLPNEEGGWTKLKLSKLDEHEEDGRLITWQAAQQGTLEPRDFVEFEDLDLTRAGSVAGFPGGLSGQEQGLQLRSLAGQNMALNSRTSDPNLVDGDITKGVAFRKGAASLGQGVRTDLGRLLLLERVRVLTEPPGRNNTYEDLSLRGYSILISRDGIGYREVGARNQITTYHESEVAFPPTPARHVSLTITEFSSRDANPKVGELEVFVQGRDDRGAYLSPPLDLNTSETKNFERAIRFGEVPDNTEMDLRFRSGEDGESWSEWSPWSTESEVGLNVPEPRNYLQFEARMLSPDSRRHAAARQPRDLVRGGSLSGLPCLRLHLPGAGLNRRRYALHLYPAAGAGGHRRGRRAPGHPDPLAGPTRCRRRSGFGRGGHRLQLRHGGLPRADLRSADHLGHRDDGGGHPLHHAPALRQPRVPGAALRSGAGCLPPGRQARGDRPGD